MNIGPETHFTFNCILNCAELEILPHVHDTGMICFSCFTAISYSNSLLLSVNSAKSRFARPTAALDYRYNSNFLYVKLQDENQG